MTLTQKLRTNRAALVEARQNHTAARETVAALIDRIGYENAVEIIAAMVNAKGEWDGRISEINRTWAAEQSAPARDELDNMCVWYCDEIHPAHMDEIANAIRTAEKPAEPQEEPAAEEAPADPVYLEERAPESNEIPGVFYSIEILTAAGLVKEELAATVEHARSIAAQVKRSGGKITSAYRYDTNSKTEQAVIIETRQEKTDRENREHCQRIAEGLEEYADGLVYRCTDCDSICTVEEEETEDSETIYRTSCGCTLEEEPEQLSIYDFLQDVYDIEYRVGSDGEYRSAKIMVACGGPNIYIDTARRLVTLHWWTDYAEYHISSSAADAIDECMQELWEVR